VVSDCPANYYRLSDRAVPQSRPAFRLRA